MSLASPSSWLSLACCRSFWGGPPDPKLAKAGSFTGSCLKQALGRALQAHLQGLVLSLLREGGALNLALNGILRPLNLLLCRQATLARVMPALSCIAIEGLTLVTRLASATAGAAPLPPPRQPLLSTLLTLLCLLLARAARLLLVLPPHVELRGARILLPLGFEVTLHCTLSLPWLLGLPPSDASAPILTVLSYQLHHRRSEHWIVVAGTAVVTLDGADIIVEPGSSIDIPRESDHRVRNDGTEPLEFIEVQMGDYFGEDDIVRLEDDYGRAGQ